MSAAVEQAIALVRRIASRESWQSHYGKRWEDEAVEIVAALAAQTPPAPSEGEYEDRFWLIVREPGKIPDLRGPWQHAEFAERMRAEIKESPTAYIDVLTIDHLGPDVQHGPEALQMADGRSMGVGRKHNERTRAAHADALAAPSQDGAIKALRRLVDATATLVKRTGTEGGFYREWSAADRAVDNARSALAALSKGAGA